MSPQTSQSDLESCKLAYLSGDWKSVSELARSHNINLKTLHGRIQREGWDKEREESLRKVEKKVECKVLSMAEEVLQTGYLRSKRLHALVDASIAQHATDAQGREVCDSSDLDAYTRSELRIHELQKSCARIAPVAQAVTLDHTISLVSVISDLRKATDKPVLDDSQYQRIIDLADDSKT